MNIRISKIILIIALLAFVLLNGCRNSEFKNDYESFKISYLKITDVIDSKNPLTSIKNLYNEAILEELEELSSIVSKMNREASTKHEIGILGNVTNYYEGLEFLQYAAKNIDSLSEEERGRIASEITFIEMNRISIKRGEV